MHYETEPYRSTTYGLLTLSGLVNGVLRLLRSTTKDCNAPSAYFLLGRWSKHLNRRLVGIKDILRQLKNMHSGMFDILIYRPMASQ